MKANDFDKQFDEGVSVMPFADMSQAARPNKLKRVNVDFPVWMVDALDNEARRMGVSRQALVKIWMADRLRRESHSAP